MNIRGYRSLVILLVAVMVLVIFPVAQVLAGGYPLSSSDPRIQAALEFIRNSETEHPALWANMEKTCYTIVAVEACGADAHTFTDTEGESLVDIIREKAPSLLKPQSSASLAHEYYLFAIVAAGENPRNFAGIDVVQQLKDMFDGSQIGMPGIINDDFWAIISLVGAGESPDSQVIQASKNHIINNQSPDGGWGSVAGGSESDPCDTANAIMALRAAGESSSSAAIQAGLTYIKSTQRSDGGFPYMDSYGSDTGTDARVIAALEACGIDPTGSAWSQNGQNAVTHALSLQQPDGGFAWQNGGTTDAWMTTYIMPALVGKHWPPDLFTGGTTSPTPSYPTSQPTTTSSGNLPAGDYVAPVISDFTPSSQDISSTSTPTIGAVYSDSDSGIDTAAIVLRVDAIDVSALATITESGITYIPISALGNGTHIAELIVYDRDGNRARRAWNFNVSAATESSSAIDITGIIGTSGTLTQAIDLTSEDCSLLLRLSEGTKLLDINGTPVTQVDTRAASGELVISEDLRHIGPAYMLEPEGASIEPSAQVTLVYQERISGEHIIWDLSGDGLLNATDIAISGNFGPDRIQEESFTIAYYDAQQDAWIALPESRVDTANNIVTAPLGQMAPVTIIGNPAAGQPSGEVASSDGEILESPDGMAELYIVAGTASQGSADLSLVPSDVDITTRTPEPPEDTCRLGLVYRLGPDDTRFTSPTPLTLHYKEVLLSEVIRWDTSGDGSIDILDDAVVTAPEDFYIARFDTTGDSWKPLQSIVSREDNTVTAEVTEAGYYTLVGPATRPFVVHGIEARPQEVNLGEETVFTVYVENPGDSRGTFLIPLEIDGFFETSQEVTLPPGQHEITFNHREPYAGTHEVAALGVTSEFTVNQITADGGSWWDSIDIVFWLYVIIGVICIFIIIGAIVLAGIWRRKAD